MSKKIPAIVAIIWCISVMASYYNVNAGYFSEKISVFGGYFLAFVK